MTRVRILAAIALLLVPLMAEAQGAARPLRTRNVVLVMTDGLRWQELLGGAQLEFMGKAGNVGDTAALRRDFWRDTAEQRRRTMMPFFWDSIVGKGQLFGDSAAGSLATVLNAFRFSYPGYSETFTGHADPRINSNGYAPNPNTTVFEWLNGQPGLRGRVAAYATWDAFSRILNAERSGIPVLDGWERGAGNAPGPRTDMLRSLYASTSRLWRDNTFDALMHQSMLEGVLRTKPRVLFVGYGETDEWAHMGRYDMYLRSARQVDASIAELWRTLQADPAYRGTTTLIVTTDHGRGTGPRWRDHGEDVLDAGRMWIAMIGPDTPPIGVRSATGPVHQAQVAATIAALLGFDWTKAEPRAAPVLPGVIR